MNAHRVQAEFYRTHGTTGGPLFLTLAVEHRTQFFTRLSYSQLVSEGVKPHEATKDFASRARFLFEAIGVINDFEFNVVYDDLGRRTWRLTAVAWVAPHDSERRAFEERFAREMRPWQECLADIVGMTERVAEVKVRDIAYRDEPTQDNFDALMSAREKLRPTEWKQLAGRDHYRRIDG